MYTSLLERQIRRYVPSNSNGRLIEFFAKVNESYLFYEQDRLTLERAMELSSNELISKNEELNKLNNSLRKSKNSYKKLLEYNHVGIVTIDGEAKITLSNGIFLEMLGFTESQLISKHLPDLLETENAVKLKTPLKLLLNGSIHDFTMENMFIDKINNIVFTHTKFFGEYDKEGKFIQATATILNISDRKHQEEELLENISAIENLERERLAYTLHDGIAQDMAVTHFMLKDVISDLNMQGIDTKKLFDLDTILAKTINDVRKVSYNLNPDYITKVGLRASLESLVEDLNRNSTSTFFSFISNVRTEKFSKNAQLTLYRMVQEAINNIINHSYARDAKIHFIRSGKTITLIIEDDGIGFDYENQISNTNSIGLKNLQNRAKSIGAEITIDSDYNQGSRISVKLLAK